MSKHGLWAKLPKCPIGESIFTPERKIILKPLPTPPVLKPCETFARALARRIITDCIEANKSLAHDPGAFIPIYARTKEAPRFEAILSPRDATTLLEEAEEREEDSMVPLP